jgi:hypothetical protein
VSHVEWKNNMPKNVIQDIKPDRGNIIRTLHQEKVGVKKDIPVEQPRRLPLTPRVRRAKNGYGKSFLIFFFVGVFLILGYFFVTYFENARVSITAKHQAFVLAKDQFTASKDPSSPIHFEIMIITDTGFKEMVLTQSADVSLKAQGEIMLYNEFSTAPQKLLINTRLADESGKAYTTDEAVVIPGYTLDKDKKVIPGSIKVGVHAFLPGDTYNATPTSLTITGFKGTAKATKIYAKALTPIAGGAQGLVYTLSPEEKGSLSSFASSTFRNNLLKKVDAQVPPGYILYPDALSFTYTTDTEKSFPTPNAKVGVSGTLSALLLKKDDVSRSIIKHFISGISDKEIKEITLPELEKLSFAFTNPSQVITKEMQSVSYTLTGSLDATWHPDVDTLKTNLIGIPKANVSSVFATDPGVANAEVKVFPPWQSYIPRKLEKIDITVK